MASAVPDGVVVRTASVADTGALAAIGSSSFRDAYAAHSAPDDLEIHLQEHFTPAAVQRAMEAGESDYLIALVADAPSGLAKYRKQACPRPGGHDNAIEIQQLYVLASSQGHGVGRHLVERVIEIAEQQDAAGVWLQAWEMADWATGFYRRVGFAEIDKVSFKLGETSYVDLLMWQPLEVTQ